MRLGERHDRRIYKTFILGTALLNFGTWTSNIARARPASFLPFKSKFFGPRADKCRRAETTSGGSLGRPK